VGQAFPRVVAEVDGRLSKAVKVQKSPGKDLIKDFAVSVQGTQTPPSTEAKSSQDSASESDEKPEQTVDTAEARRVLGNYIDYEKTYKAKYVIRPDNPDCVKVPVIFNKRITPPDYDRNIIHISFRVEGSGELATYEAGDCISIFPQNKQELVDDFLSKMGWDGSQLLELDSFFAGAEDGVYVMSLQNMVKEYLDLFGEPNKGFYLALSKYTKDIIDKETLAELSLPRKSADYEKRQKLSVTFASTILEFPTVKLTPMELLDVVPTTKPRLYSIASSVMAHPGHVELLIVENTWDNSKKEECFGLSSSYISKLTDKDNHYVMPHCIGGKVAEPKALSTGSMIVASLVRNGVLKLPSDPKKPVIMAGMGTGLAPFRAFIEERAVLKKQGHAVGKMRLYFGARHKWGEWLFGDELEAYEAQGFLKNRCAWSRDQKQKIYVQNLIAEDDEEIWDALRPEHGGSFYVCGPIQPLPDIKKAITKIFENHGLDGKYLEEMEATGRFATEVY
jgi:sulfite reductase (NADPH) flavoprotein alpha-component